MRRSLAAALCGLVIVPFAWAGAFPGKAETPYSKQVACGVERWGVKTLADPLARRRRPRSGRCTGGSSFQACGAIEASRPGRFEFARPSSR